jgi:tetratricopeptide (TPR) repeat protein
VATRAVVLLVVLLGGAAMVRAQDQPGDLARSRALYDQGARAYKDGEYQKAVELFLAAYDLSRAPAILFNVAQAYRLQGECSQALSYYRRSLAEEPDATNRAEVEDRIAEMQRCVDDQSRDQETAPEAAQLATPPRPVAAGLTAPSPERPSKSRPVLALVTMAVGGAAAVTGGVIYLQARSKFAEVESSCPCEPGSFSGWETATDASYLLMGAGVVAAGAGLIWWWRGSDREPRRIGLVPTARGVEWVGWF